MTDVINFFGNHVVGISCIHQADNQSDDYLHATAFVVAVNGQWGVATAGHVIDHFQKRIEAGGECVMWRLDDTLGTNTVSDKQIPFDIRDRHCFQLYHEDLGYDYSIVLATDNDRKLMERNGIIALSEQAWLHDLPQEFDGYLLLGFPREDVTDENSTITKQLVAIDLKSIPDECVESEVPSELIKDGEYACKRLYFKWPKQNVDSPGSLAGTSGGPIFGFKKREDGRNRYWLVGIQSAAAKYSAITIACPVGLFLEMASAYLSIYDVDANAV